MVHLAGIKSGEISNSRGSLKAAGLSKSRGHPLGVSQGRKLLDFTRGFCDAARGRQRQDFQIVKEQKARIS